MDLKEEQMEHWEKIYSSLAKELLGVLGAKIAL